MDLVLRSLNRRADGAQHAELARAAASCLRAVLRGSSNDGGGKTAVGVGERGAEITAAVEEGLVALDLAGLRCVVGRWRVGLLVCLTRYAALLYHHCTESGRENIAYLLLFVCKDLPGF